MLFYFPMPEIDINLKHCIMKKFIRIATSALILIGMVVVCGTTTSCKSQGEVMYKTHNENTKTIKQNYRVKGTNERNRQTYRSY